jgi:hypothetical protein
VISAAVVKWSDNLSLVVNREGEGVENPSERDVDLSEITFPTQQKSVGEEIEKPTVSPLLLMQRATVSWEFGGSNERKLPFLRNRNP